MNLLNNPETNKPMGLDLPPVEFGMEDVKKFAAVTGSAFAVAADFAAAGNVERAYAEDPATAVTASAPTEVAPPSANLAVEDTPVAPTPVPAANNTASKPGQNAVNVPPETILSKPRVRPTKFRKTSAHCGIAAIKLSAQPGYPVMREVTFGYGLFSSQLTPPYRLRQEHKELKYKRVTQRGVKIPIRICDYEKRIKLFIGVKGINLDSFEDTTVSFHTRRKQWVGMSLSRPFI